MEVNAKVGAVVDTVRARIVHDVSTLRYSIVSQTLDGAEANVFAISEKEEEGINVGELTLATNVSLIFGQIYMLSIQVSDGEGGTDVAEASIEVVPGPPAAPVNLIAIAVSDTQINLGWDAPSDDGEAAITNYYLQFSTGGGDFEGHFS